LKTLTLRQRLLPCATRTLSAPPVGAERGFDAKDVRELFSLLDWLMTLRQALESVLSLCRN
jgi:hypothetical protein